MDTETRVLILDDDPQVSETLMVLAKSLGCLPKSIDSVESLLGQILTWGPHVIILDLNVPQLKDGRFALRQIAELGFRAGVVIASGTGQAELNEEAETARKLGLKIQGVLLKPFSLQEFKRVLKGPPMQSGGAER